MNNITADGSWDWSRVVRVPVRSKHTDKFLLQSGDVMFNNTNSQELVGKTAMFKGYAEPITFSNHFTRLRPGPDLDPGYLAFWLHRLWQSRYFYRASTRWVGQAAFGTGQLIDLEISVPDLTVQRRISAEIERQLAAALRARSACRDMETNAGDLRSATYASAFAGTGSNVSVLRLVRVARLIRGVSFDGDEASPSVAPGLWPILRAGNISERLDVDKDLVWVPASRVSDEQRLRRGDIAICMSSGSAKVVGKSAALEVEFEGSVGAFCAIIRPTESIRPKYLAAWLRSPEFLSWRDGQSRGANIQNLKLSALGELELHVPELHAQDEALRNLDRRLVVLTSMMGAIGAELQAIDALPASILRHALDQVGYAGGERDSSLPTDCSIR